MSTSNKPELIGVAGTFASGKDTVTHRLVDDFGFTHISTSDTVREVAMKERGSIERPVLQEVAPAYRKKHGAGIFVELALKASRPLVVTGLRSMGEAKAIKAAGGVVIFIDAPVELRYERMKARERDKEMHLTLEGFKANEAREWHVGDNDADFSLYGIKQMADYVFDSSAGRDEFTANVYRTLGLHP